MASLCRSAFCSKQCWNYLKSLYIHNYKGQSHNLKTRAWTPHMHLEIFHCLATKLHKTLKSKAKQKVRNTYRTKFKFQVNLYSCFFSVLLWHAYRPQPKQQRMSEKAVVDHNYPLFPCLQTPKMPLRVRIDLTNAQQQLMINSKLHLN